MRWVWLLLVGLLPGPAVAQTPKSASKPVPSVQPVPAKPMFVLACRVDKMAEKTNCSLGLDVESNRPLLRAKLTVYPGGNVMLVASPTPIIARVRVDKAEIIEMP